MERSNTETIIEGVDGILDTFIIEPFCPHTPSEEYYVCIQSLREGEEILFYHEGGVDVGDVDSKANRVIFDIDVDCDASKIENVLLKEVPEEKRKVLGNFIFDLFNVYRELNFVYMEINPIVVVEEKIYYLGEIRGKMDVFHECDVAIFPNPRDTPSDDKSEEEHHDSNTARTFALRPRSENRRNSSLPKRLRLGSNRLPTSVRSNSVPRRIVHPRIRLEDGGEFKANNFKPHRSSLDHGRRRWSQRRLRRHDLRLRLRPRTRKLR